MKTRLLVLAFFLLFMAQAGFAGTATNCVGLPSVPDSSGGPDWSSFNCDFYHEAVYPFNFTTLEAVAGGALYAKNELGAGYVIWTTATDDVGKLSSQGDVLTNPGAVRDILDFDDNLNGGSSQVILYWPATGFPTAAAMTADPLGGGWETLLWDPSGVQVLQPDAFHTFTVHDSLPGAVPEPSTLLLVLAGGLGTLIVRRRRC